MDRRQVLTVLLAGGAVTTLSGVPSVPLTEDEFNMLTVCAIDYAHGDLAGYPHWDPDSFPVALCADMARRGLTELHENQWIELPDGTIITRYYLATEYGRQVLRAECERA